MAELHVQRKKKSSWVLWLIIILIIAAAVYYLYINYYNPGSSPAFSSVLEDLIINIKINQNG